MRHDPSCQHRELVLLEPRGAKLRCRRCHLTIDEKDLAEGGYCPECYAVESVSRRDFERIDAADDARTRYSCERCGMIITV